MSLAWQPGEPENTPSLPGAGLLSHWVPQCPSPAPTLPKDWGINPDSTHALGDKGGATRPLVPKKEPPRGCSRGRGVLCSPPAVPSPGVVLVVAMGEAVARSQGWEGRVWPWEEEVMGLGTWVLGRCEFPHGKRPNSAQCVSWVAGHGPAWGGTGDPSPPCLQIPVCLSVAAQRRCPPTAHRCHCPPPHHPPPGLSLLSLRFCTR